MTVAAPTALLSVSHYHQAPKTQPNPNTIADGVELVELVTGGRGWLWHEEEWVEVTPGALIWHVAGDQTIARSDPENPYSCLAVSMARAPGRERRTARISFWHDLRAGLELTESAIPLFLDETFDRRTLLDYLFSTLRFWAELHQRRRERLGLAEPLRRARELIETRYAESLKVSDLARAAGWSVAHLHDQFRAAFQSTPRQEILSRRLRAAREQLVSSGRSIKQIAADTGFTHSSAFCSAFRRAFGQTPKAYRDAFYYGFGVGSLAQAGK